MFDTDLNVKTTVILYLLLTECDGRIVMYGRNFFSAIYGPNAKCTGHKSKRKKEDISFISTVYLTGSGTISIHAELLKISDAPRKQNESI